jgi:RNA polymerase sigma factor (sigma-70 family)
MADQDDYDLLRQFVDEKSQAAFTLLVQRHLNFVYSSALRQTGNPSAAEEISQVVFIILAKKAASLRKNTILAGWLYQTTRLTSANYRRNEIRRVRREQEAHMQSMLNDSESSPNEVWSQMAPLLDDALCTLGERDRNALVLRFLENKSLREVGVALGTSEDAAKMRVNRSLEKLRKIFGKRGVIVSATLLASAMSANAVQAAPVSLAATVAANAETTTGISATTLTLMNGTMKTMIWLKLKFAVVTGIGLVCGGIVTMALTAALAATDSKSTQDGSFLIVPGASVGQIRKGMTTNQVETALGKPDKWQGKFMVYDKQLGLSVGQTSQGVAVVLCGDSMLKYAGVKKFKGRTKEGIGMLSTRDNVIKAFGQPTSAQPWNDGQQQLKYNQLGLTFVLESGKVIHITVDFRASMEKAAR